jgi:tRNA-Thr(GGU) m(6)t(6)A37 methyltransferase TsaA
VPGELDYRAEALGPARDHTTPKDAGPGTDRTRISEIGDTPDRRTDQPSDWRPSAAGAQVSDDLLGLGEPATPTRASAAGSIWADRGPVPAAHEQTVVVQTSYGLVPVGWVQSALKVLGDAPNQREGAPQAWISFDEQVAEGAKDLRPGDEIVVLTWLHLSPRDELSTHPEDDISQPLTGVFSTCSPNRPNPIGLHRARIVARDGLRIEVDALEAIDGTPVVDVKPAIDPPA